MTIFSPLLRQMGRNDIRLVSRDQLTFGLLIYPVINLLLLRYAARPLATWALARYEVDLVPYFPLAVSFMLVLMAPMFLGMILGLLLVEERADDTLTALRVTPLAVGQLVGYRLVLGWLTAALMLLAFVPLTGLVAIPWWQLFLLSISAALFAPVCTLLFFMLASDKVQAFAVLKGLAILNIVPLAAFFTPLPWQYLFTIHPIFGAVKGFWLAADGSGGAAALHLFMALVYNGVITAVLQRRVNRQ